MSMETSDGKPCEKEVDVGSAFCGAGHLCVSRPVDQAPRAPTAASSDPRPVEDILAVSGDGTERLVMMSPSAADDGGFVAMADVTRAAGLADMDLGMRVGSAGVSAFMWVAALLSVAAVGLLGAGRRRWSGLTLLASGFFIAAAANWLTPLGVHNTTDLFVCGAVPFSAAFGDGSISSLGNVDFSLGVTLLVPAALLMFLPSRRVAGVSLVRGLALAFGALIALVVLSAVIPWLGQNPGLALLIGISGASVFAPIDGRISLAASAIMLVDLPLLTRALWSANILPQTSSDTPWIPTVLIAAVILAAWGWLWTGRRRAHLPANLVN